MIKEIINRANFLTYIGLLIAVIGIQMCSIGNTNIAVICLIICGICDSFDGTVALKLRKKDDKGFGIQLDSLVDIISSGILPVIICFSLGFNSTIDTIIYCIYIITGVTRLAYYNVHCEIDRDNFIGLPITTSTIVIPTISLFTKNEIVFISALALLSIIFVSPVKIKKINLNMKIILAIVGIIGIAIFVIGSTRI